jgi:hypothetical protein
MTCHPSTGLPGVLKLCHPDRESPSKSDTHVPPLTSWEREPVDPLREPMPNSEHPVVEARRNNIPT